jgi:hypothetical protein
MGLTCGGAEGSQEAAVSVYQLNKLCYDLKRAENREALRADADRYYRRYRLDEDELSALRSGNYAWLYEHGVNVYVLTTHAGLHGYRLPQLQELMRRQYAELRAAAL